MKQRPIKPAHCRLRFSVYLRSVVNPNLNESSLLVVEYTVVSVLPVAVVIEFNTSCEALGVFR